MATAVAGLLAGGPAAQGNDIEIILAEDRVDHRTFDPRVTQSRHEEQVITQIFDQLLSADENGNRHPGLAKSWQVSDDNLSYTFQLRDDVTFHDGTPFNAEAVKFTFDTIVDPELGSQGAVDIIGPYASTEVLGEHEVRVNFSRPYGAALGAFAETELSIVSPTAVKAKGNNGFAQSPVGTGPFKFNWARYADAGLDKMLEDAESAATAEARDELYGAIQKQIMDEAIILPIHNQVQTIAHTSELTGFRLAAGQWQVRFYEVKKAE